MKIAEEHDSSAETGTGERSAYAAFPFSIFLILFARLSEAKNDHINPITASRTEIIKRF